VYYSPKTTSLPPCPLVVLPDEMISGLLVPLKLSARLPAPRGLRLCAAAATMLLTRALLRKPKQIQILGERDICRHATASPTIRLRTGTTTKQQLARLQIFHMKSQRKILGVHWQDHVTNICIQKRTGLSHVGNLIQTRRHLFGHIVRLPPTVPCNAMLGLSRDISMNRRIPVSWCRHRGRPRTSWMCQVKKDTGVPIATSWSRAENRQLWRLALTGYAIQRRRRYIAFFLYSIFFYNAKVYQQEVIEPINKQSYCLDNTIFIIT